MSKIIRLGENARVELERGIDTLAECVKITLGPKGKNVVLTDGFLSPFVTNDGVTIAKSVELKNPVENAGAKIIKEVCIKTNEEAGDGTTTATILAQAIMKEGIKNTVAGANQIIVRKGIEKAVNVAVEFIKSKAVQIDDFDKIAQVATISSGDESVGKLIADAMKKVGKDGIINIEDGNSVCTELGIVEGFRFEKGYISPYMISDENKKCAESFDSYILLTDKKIVNSHEIMHIIEQVAKVGGQLVIIADNVEGEAIATLVLNKIKGIFTSFAIKAPSFGQSRKELLQDMAILTGAKFVDAEIDKTFKNISIEDLGRAKKVVITKDSTTIIEGRGKKDEIDKRIEMLKMQQSEVDNSFERDKLQERIASFSAGVAIIKVGAMSEIEMKEKKLRIEDALYATKSAVEEGVVAGGGTILARASLEVEKFLETLSGDEKVGAQIVVKALVAPLKQIAINSGNDAGVVCDKVLKSCNDNFGFDALKNEFCDLFKCGIIDPAKVGRCALQNSASVASTLLTTDCVIVEDENKN